jgi:hypothetical protein
LALPHPGTSDTPMHQAARLVSRHEEASGLPRAATVYGIRELARRAGVSPDFFRSWRIEFEEDEFVDVFIKSGTNRRIRFAQTGAQFWKEIHSGTVRTAVATWPRGMDAKTQPAPELLIPYSSSERREVGALFAHVAPDCCECPLDLPTSTVLVLSRFEETVAHNRDEHDRFSALSSIAWRDGFLHRPIVDEWGMAMAQALQALCPGWRPAKHSLRVKLGHDADVLGIPIIFRSTLAHTLRRGRPDATVRDILSQFSGMDTTYQKMLRQLVQLSVEYQLDSAVYWKFSASGPHDTGYDPRHPRIQALISDFQRRGVEMGVHPGYQSFRAPSELKAEVTRLQEMLGDRKLGGRQDYLRWRPETWIEWESLGLAYDASVGFADRVGFRAGTCHPYRPWLLSLGREAELLEIPLIAMDTTLQGYMKLSPEQAFDALLDCVDRCRAVGGVFHLVWHNTSLMHHGYAAIYRRLLKELAGSETYDWRNSGDELC